MNEAFNFHALFQNPTDKAFIAQLEVDAETTRILDDAVEKVKAALAPALAKIARDNGVPSQYALPRFRLQGSKVYKTQNRPAHVPQQQVDVDLGTYLSAAFLDNASNGNPGRKFPARALARLYFDTVDSILRQLCRQHGWKYAEGKKQKDTCCRIDLSPTGAHAHIDVPLYAAPNEQFARARTLDEYLIKSFAEAKADISHEIDRDGWDELTVVVMATRSGEWEESDIQVVIQHFRVASERFGHPVVLRRLWRYVKAWRDFVWRDGGGPSSILLMEAIVRILDADLAFSRELLGCGRDDRILHYIFSNLAAQLEDDVQVQWGRMPESLNLGNVAQRAQWSGMSRACHANLHKALFDAGLYFSQVIALIQEHFGQRIPSDMHLIKFLAVTSAAPFVSTPPKHQPSPQERVRRTGGA